MNSHNKKDRELIVEMLEESGTDLKLELTGYKVSEPEKFCYWDKSKQFMLYFQRDGMEELFICNGFGFSIEIRLREKESEESVAGLMCFVAWRAERFRNDHLLALNRPEIKT
jgi:hypothetical protein